MKITLVPASLEDKSVLASLYQFYYYDFSVYTGQDVSLEGAYAVDIDYMWEGDRRWQPYFINVSGTLAGFLIVLKENLDSEPDPTHVIYDFTVLRKFRRNGIGSAAALQAFDLYRANWTVAQMASNAPAIAFWRKVIAAYTGDSFTERYREDRDKYVQSFSNKA